MLCGAVNIYYILSMIEQIAKRVIKGKIVIKYAFLTFYTNN